MDLPLPPTLAAPAKRALAAAGIHSLTDLASHTEPEVLKLHGMGPNAVSRLKLAMQDAGVRFATTDALSTDPAIEKFLSELNHPMQSGIEAMRQILLYASPDIREGIKWNSLSFRTTEWFATLNRRATDRVEFVLHLGAKVKEDADTTAVPDPAGLLKWLAKDRGLLTLHNEADVRSKRPAIEALIQAWIRHI